MLFSLQGPLWALSTLLCPGGPAHPHSWKLMTGRLAVSSLNSLTKLGHAFSQNKRPGSSHLGYLLGKWQHHATKYVATHPAAVGGNIQGCYAQDLSRARGGSTHPKHCPLWAADSSLRRENIRAFTFFPPLGPRPPFSTPPRRSLSHSSLQLSFIKKYMSPWKEHW